MNLDEMIQLGTLKLKADLNGHNVERLFGDLPSDEKITRNVCAAISVPLFDALEEACQRLSVTKRQFIEACLVEGISRAEASLAQLQHVLEG